MYKRLIGYSTILFFLGIGCVGVFAYAAKPPATSGATRLPQRLDPEDQVAPEEVKRFLRLLSRDGTEFQEALAEIDEKWHEGYCYELLEVIQFLDRRQRANVKLLLAKKTGQEADMSLKDWRIWSWNQEYKPDPHYADFKRYLLRRIDSRFESYFTDTKNAKIRLDEIRWGGVKRDGIPPLKNPKMLAAGDAKYLGDSDVVFGVELNGDARCYPKRILAWHEMFKDTIGGESVCGVY